MQNEFERAIAKAYSSKLRIERHDGRDVIVKYVDARERKNELAFHGLLRELGLPAMKIKEEGEDLVIDFISGSETLEDDETVERYKALGKALRILHGREYKHAFSLNQDAQEEVIDWRVFIERQMKTGMQRQVDRNGFDQEQVEAMTVMMNDGFEADRFVPLHGDLHGNNILFSEQNVYLFDKADHIFAGDSLYDLALLGIELPGIYGVGTKKEQQEHAAFFDAFIDGYGEHIDRTQFDRYVLLRALERWPNKFESDIPQIVEVILKAA